jgi:hypothetical protein
VSPIVFVEMPAYGHVNPTLPRVHELAARGRPTRTDPDVEDGRSHARPPVVSYTLASSRACTDGLSMGTPITEPYSVQLPS